MLYPCTVFFLHGFIGSFFLRVFTRASTNVFSPVTGCSILYVNSQAITYVGASNTTVLNGFRNVVRSVSRGFPSASKFHRSVKVLRQFAVRFGIRFPIRGRPLRSLSRAIYGYNSVHQGEKGLRLSTLSTTRVRRVVR